MCPLERQGIKRYAEGLGMIPNLVSSKQNIIMISSSLLDILQELMPKLSRKSCVVHSMAIKKLQCVCNNEINSFGENWLILIHWIHIYLYDYYIGLIPYSILAPMTEAK